MRGALQRRESRAVRFGEHVELALEIVCGLRDIAVGIREYQRFDSRDEHVDLAWGKRYGVR